MLTQFISIGLLMLLTVMLPGPDFALVTKNSILFSRRAGLFTSFGISAAVLLHMTYCMLGLAVIISHSILVFSIIKYIGAFYLLYLGYTTLFAKESKKNQDKSGSMPSIKNISDLAAFKQGFLCNLFNPKATLFFLALFTMIIKPGTSTAWELAYAALMWIIVVTWFCSLTFILSNKYIVRILNSIEKYIEKTVGILFIGFGIALAFVKN